VPPRAKEGSKKTWRRRKGMRKRNMGQEDFVWIRNGEKVARNKKKNLERMQAHGAGKNQTEKLMPLVQPISKGTEDERGAGKKEKSNLGKKELLLLFRCADRALYWKVVIRGKKAGWLFTLLESGRGKCPMAGVLQGGQGVVPN